MVENNEGAMPKLLDVIDLTQDLPMTTRNMVSHERISRHVSGSTSKKPTRRDTASNRIVRKKNNSRETAKSTIACNNVASINETVNLDDTILIKDDDKHYAVTSDEGELTSLQCPICFESLSSELKPTTTRCGHVFCAQCIEQHVPISKKCPTCNTSITLKSCTRLFL